MRRLWRVSGTADEVDDDELWRVHLRSQRESRRALRWTLLLAVGRKLISWDLLREPKLQREIPAGSSGVCFFVPVQQGGVPLEASGRIRGLPLQTRLIPLDEEGLPGKGARVSVVLKGGPLVVLSVRETAGAAWRLRARFQERAGWRAARLGFQRLAPEGGGFRRLGKLMMSSLALLSTTFRRAVRTPGQPPAVRVSDFYLAEISPRQLSSRAFWPTLAMGTLLCPLLAGLLAAALLQGLGGSYATLGFCLLVAMGVAWTGGMVCGSTVSYIAATIGAIPLTTGLATLDGMLFEAGGGLGGLLGQLAAKPLRDVALGGLPMLARAPAWGVALVDAGLLLLSFAMAAARRSSGAKKTRKLRPAKVAATVAACAGPGLVAGVSLLLAERLTGSWPLLVSLGLVGGAAFSSCIALQSASRRRAVIGGALYAAVCFLLPLLLSGLQGTLGGLLLVAVGIHVLLQGTFFALAYLLGESLGGVWTGAVVSSLQGAGGYTIFLIAMGAVR